MSEAVARGGRHAAKHNAQAAPPGSDMDRPSGPDEAVGRFTDRQAASNRGTRRIQQQVCWFSLSGLLALLALADCSGRSGMGAPNIVFTTPSSATQVSSDAPETFGGPPPEPNLPATIPSGPSWSPR